MNLFIVVVLGLIFGSFNSVLISRISTFIETEKYDWKGILVGRSNCAKCGVVLKWYNLIPLFSFIFQRGRCSSCKEKYGVFYPMIELITAISFGLVFWFGFGGELSWQSLVGLVIVNLGIVISGIDYKTKCVPLFLSVPMMVFGLLYGHFFAELNFLQIIIGGVIGYSFFGLQYLVSKGRWVGLGDADLGVVIGFMFGPLVGIYTILQSYILGTLVLLPLIVVNKDKYSLKLQIPFGPFLISSLILSMMFGRIVVDWYVNNYIIF